ncbi:hypothetical protein FOZ62_026830, partial [Perkinsus olseni]
KGANEGLRIMDGSPERAGKSAQHEGGLLDHQTTRPGLHQIPPMATTHILIAALASAVFISNLPVSNALGALAPQVEDFPPLIEWELEPLGYDDGIVGYEMYCFYGSGEVNTDDWTELKVRIEEEYIWTKSIDCPGAIGRKGFSNLLYLQTADSSVALGAHLDDFQARGEDMISFRSPPPRNSGLDPLRGLDNSTFTPMLRELGDHTEGVLSRYQAQIKPAYKLLKRICLSLREAMMRKFGSFGSMCDEYYRMSKNAIKTAEDEGWQHEEKNSQGIDYIHPPGLRLYMD